MLEVPRTFGAPSPAECFVNCDNISQIDADTSKPDNEIERISKLLHTAHRDASLHTSTSLQNVLHPTHRLPVEILGDIFIHWRGMAQEKWEEYGKAWSTTPAEVCQQWRAVAVSNSRLWSHLNIPCHSQNPANTAELTRIWLDRSGSRPLAIEVGYTFLGHIRRRWGSVKENISAFELIKEQAYRWKTIRIRTEKTCGLTSLLENIPENLPLLSILDISGLSRPETSLKKLKYAPALRELILDRNIFSFFAQFPWAQLTSCVLGRAGNYTCQDGYRVIGQALRLQTCELHLDATFTFDTMSHPIHHANLLTLRVTVLKGAMVWQLLNAITAPALTTLQFAQCRAGDPGGPDHLVSLITRSDCRLERMEIDNRGGSFTHHDILTLLSLTPMLSELELRNGAGVGLGDSMMDLLTHRPNHGTEVACCLLPQLLSISLPVHRGFSYEKYVAFLSSRLENAVCHLNGTKLAALRETALMEWDSVSASGRHPRRVPPQTFAQYVALRDRGMTIQMGYVSIWYPLEKYFRPGDEADDPKYEDDGDLWADEV
ncbi:hypothetical protein HWV62_35548 [Athelia sp. TMB]|nr:hypothetical protein HWV62_35548 [Athelia sp. TMB]